MITASGRLFDFFLHSFTYPLSQSLLGPGACPASRDESESYHHYCVEQSGGRSPTLVCRAELAETRSGGSEVLTAVSYKRANGSRSAVRGSEALMDSMDVFYHVEVCGSIAHRSR
jgi:hypothetical protein